VVLSTAAVAIHFITAEDPPLTLGPADMASISATDAFAEVHGDGLRQLHLFESVDCIFCRKAEPELSKLSNVTIYRHLLPGHTPAARASATQVWCAGDPVAAWRDAVKGAPAHGKACVTEALDRNYALGKRLGITGTPAIVFPDGRVMIGLMNSAEMSEALKRK
jgi:thiol:disulfide interchange protein DsbC